MNKENLPWVKIIWETYYQHNTLWHRLVGTFWWRAILKLLPLYKFFANCKATVGDIVYFWSDDWG